MQEGLVRDALLAEHEKVSSSSGVVVVNARRGLHADHTLVRLEFLTRQHRQWFHGLLSQRGSQTSALSSRQVLHQLLLYYNVSVETDTKLLADTSADDPQWDLGRDQAFQGSRVLLGLFLPRKDSTEPDFQVQLG